MAEAATENARFVSLIDACIEAGLPYHLAWSAISSGRVKALRRGSRWVVRVAELRRFARERAGAELETA